MGSQVFLPVADPLSLVDLEAEIVRLRSDLPHYQRRAGSVAKLFFRECWHL